MNESARACAPARRVRALRFLSLAACAWMTSACFGLQARAVTAPAPLDMPQPPPRVVEVHEPEMPPPVPLPEEPVRNTPPRTRQTPQAPPAAADAPKATEPPKAEPSVDAARPADDTARPPTTTLQTTPAQQEGEVERRIRSLLSTALNVLNRINYQALNPDARTQYDTAKRFVSQAEEALHAKNLVFANNLADKAAALANQLGGR